MFTCLCLGTQVLERAARFYDAALAPLGITRCQTGSEDFGEWIGWGTYEDDGRQALALWVCRPFNGEPASVANGSMIALRAASWAAVDAFYAAALTHGGISEGAPGLRLRYNPDSYAAYVRDPDGHKVAAVCRGFTARI